MKNLIIGKQYWNIKRDSIIFAIIIMILLIFHFNFIENTNWDKIFNTIFTGVIAFFAFMQFKISNKQANISHEQNKILKEQTIISKALKNLEDMKFMPYFEMKKINKNGSYYNIIFSINNNFPASMHVIKLKTYKNFELKQINYNFKGRQKNLCNENGKINHHVQKNLECYMDFKDNGNTEKIIFSILYRSNIVNSNEEEVFFEFDLDKTIEDISNIKILYK